MTSLIRSVYQLIQAKLLTIKETMMTQNSMMMRLMKRSQCLEVVADKIQIILKKRMMKVT